MTRTTIEAVDLFAARFCHVTSDHARQRDDGKYFRTDKPITRDTVLAHLRGEITIAPYLMDARDTVRVGVLDHDDKRYIPNPDNPTVGRFVEEDGLALLQDARERLQRQGIDSALEESRRGGHLWVIAREPIPARDMRALLLLAAGRDERGPCCTGSGRWNCTPAPTGGRPAAWATTSGCRWVCSARNWVSWAAVAIRSWIATAWPWPRRSRGSCPTPATSMPWTWRATWANGRGCARPLR